MLRADFEAVQTYRYVDAPPLACPIVAFGGRDDDRVSHERLAAWRRQTTADFKLLMAPGDHFFLNTSQLLLLRMLNGELRGLLARGLKNGS
jgi:medium-chain acyl-[acyl-carrier-protein] hydrolase